MFCIRKKLNIKKSIFALLFLFSINLGFSQYDNYKNLFSKSDLEAAIVMFNSPIGKKISEKAPFIAQESMQVSMDWGMEIGQKMQGLIK